MMLLLLGPRLMMSSIGQACLSAEQARPWPEPAAAQRGSSNGGRGRGRGSATPKNLSPPRAPSLPPLPAFLPSSSPFPTPHPFLSLPSSIHNSFFILPYLLAPHAHPSIPFRFQDPSPHLKRITLPHPHPIHHSLILMRHPTLTTTFTHVISCFTRPRSFEDAATPSTIHGSFILISHPTVTTTLTHVKSCSHASFILRHPYQDCVPHLKESKQG